MRSLEGNLIGEIVNGEDEMNEKLIVSFVGDDRPGIIQLIADVVARLGGSWQESRMSRLGGYFSGAAQIRINPNRLEALDQELQGLEGLTVIIRPLRQAGTYKTTKKMKLDIVGPDRSGILQDVTSQLLAFDINVIEMETNVSPASMSGGLNFIADAVVEVPLGIDLELLDRQLDSVASNLGLDILLEEHVIAW